MNQFKSITVVSSLSFIALATYVGAAPSVVADFTSTTAFESNQIAAGTVKVEIVDHTGQMRIAPVIAISDASPQMQAQTSSVSIKNLGSLDASFRFSTSNLSSSTPANLNDVLRIVVKDSLNEILYVGTISELSIYVGNLPAGATLNWEITIDWPDNLGVDDNQYQASVISFALQLDASSLVS